MPFFTVVEFQLTKHELAFEHDLTVAPFAIKVIFEIFAEGAEAFAENNTLDPLTLAPDAGDEIVIVGVTL